MEEEVTVILADGQFPTHPMPLGILNKAKLVICCDGAAQKLVDSGVRMPDYIVGDLDSLSEELQNKLSSKLVKVASQDTNDLTKAFEFAQSLGVERLAILGATGLREDHTIGNISLLAKYATQAEIAMFTDYGRFKAIFKTAVLDSQKGQQVSVFTLTPNEPITYKGLKWDISSRCLNSWWEGTLNEALGESFTVEFKTGRVIVFQSYT